MIPMTPDRLQEFQSRNALDPAFAQDFVHTLLTEAIQAGASDVHLLPTATSLDLLWRLDGVLQQVGQFPISAAANILGRLKVLANLLTYYTDRPQEGRLQFAEQAIEMRLSTFPTLHAEKAVVRIFNSAGQRLSYLADLGLPTSITVALQELLVETSGAILITGPAGSGKTTTAYAALREIAVQSAAGRSLVSLEDPIEAVVSGVAQSQVNPTAGFDLATGLRSILRQDPEVILLGEIRDRETAQVACQAAMTGQLLLSTFHATTATGAIGRLHDMGIEPYVLRSALRAVIAQRLVRRLCDCAQRTDEKEPRLGLPVSQIRVPVGCDRCRQTGYLGRIVLAELLLPAWPTVGQGILAQEDVVNLNRRALEAGMVPLSQRALECAASGLTSAAEIRRVLGWEVFAAQSDV